MSETFSSDSVYYLELLSPSGENIDGGVNPIAEGLKISPKDIKDPNKSCWGYCSWFDKILPKTEIIAISEEPIIADSSITITMENTLKITFRFINKEIYDRIVKELLRGPSLADDEAVQTYIKTLNPYI